MYDRTHVWMDGRRQAGKQLGRLVGGYVLTYDDFERMPACMDGRADVFVGESASARDGSPDLQIRLHQAKSPKLQQVATSIVIFKDRLLQHARNTVQGAFLHVANGIWQDLGTWRPRHCDRALRAA